VKNLISRLLSASKDFEGKAQQFWNFVPFRYPAGCRPENEHYLVLIKMAASPHRFYNKFSAEYLSS
jgi:hypothetical protein